MKRMDNDSRYYTKYKPQVTIEGPKVKFQKHTFDKEKFDEEFGITKETTEETNEEKTTKETTNTN